MGLDFRYDVKEICRVRQITIMKEKADTSLLCQRDIVIVRLQERVQSIDFISNSDLVAISVDVIYAGRVEC